MHGALLRLDNSHPAVWPPACRLPTSEMTASCHRGSLRAKASKRSARAQAQKSPSGPLGFAAPWMQFLMLLSSLERFKLRQTYTASLKLSLFWSPRPHDKEPGEVDHCQQLWSLRGCHRPVPVSVRQVETTVFDDCKVGLAQAAGPRGSARSHSAHALQQGAPVLR